MGCSSIPLGRSEKKDIRIGLTELENVIKPVGTFAGKIKDILVDNAPDKVSLEFGIVLTTQAKAIIVGAGVDISYKVTLEWSK